MSPPFPLPQSGRGNLSRPGELAPQWCDLEVTCGAVAGRGRILDDRPSPEEREQVGVFIEEVPDDHSQRLMDEEESVDQPQSAMFPQLQYASSGAICWKNEILVDNQVVPWD